MVLETCEIGRPESLIPRNPARDVSEWRRSELVHPLAPVVSTAPLGHEPRVAQHAEMPRHRGPADTESCSQLRHGRGAASQAVEYGSARGVGDCVEGVGGSVSSGHFSWVTGWLRIMRGRANGVKAGNLASGFSVEMATMIVP